MYEWIAIILAGAAGGWVHTMLTTHVLYLPQLDSTKGARSIRFGGFREIGLGALAGLVNWGMAPGASFGEVQLHPQVIVMGIVAGAAGPSLWRYYTQAYLAGVQQSRQAIEDEVRGRIEAELGIPPSAPPTQRRPARVRKRTVDNAEGQQAT